MDILRLGVQENRLVIVKKKYRITSRRLNTGSEEGVRGMKDRSIAG